MEHKPPGGGGENNTTPHSLWHGGTWRRSTIDHVAQPLIFQIRKLRSRDRKQSSAPGRRSYICCINSPQMSAAKSHNTHFSFLTYLTCGWRFIWGGGSAFCPPSLSKPRLPELS